MGLFGKIFRSYSDKEIKRIVPIVDRIEALEPDFKRLTDAELRGKTEEFKRRIKDGQTLEQLIPEAYAAVREACVRVLEQRIYKVQMIGGVVIHQGRIAEMRTGEGKTHTSLSPAYLNSLTGEGVHIVTVNDYLAKRDSEWMGQVHNFLGVSVGVILHDMKNDERREAYNCDITYATNNELGFDYLRDNMVVYAKELVQRGLNFAIIDEIDSILVDEARTPLIISGSGTKSTQLYKVANSFVRTLKKGRVINEKEALNPMMREAIQEEGDFVIDEKQKTSTLTQDGVEKAERFFAIDNLAGSEHMEIQHHINNALKANYNMHLDKDYVVKDGEIVIVDEFTGRMMSGRRYSDGLHQAIEAKENVDVRRESKTLATITFQNYFNKYTKKSGMTGTAMTEESEFRDIYGLDVVAIPTNKPIARIDQPDQVYKTAIAKYKAITDEIIVSYEKQQPVLVGTTSIEQSELVSSLIKRHGVKHQVLNAKFHEQEAEIVAAAGEIGAVTIATNMAGRGTDIKLGEGVVELGGLKIIGTERHESRRIDNQLRGRAGRQGDPGESRFFISLEDELMRLFGSDRIKTMLGALGIPDDEAIEHKMLSKAIENAQKKVEGNNFSTRKHLLDYDSVMNDQREIIYSERRKVLDGEDLRDQILNMVREVIVRMVDTYCTISDDQPEWNLDGLNEGLKTTFADIRAAAEDMDTNIPEKAAREKMVETLYERAEMLYRRREMEFMPERMREIERVILLRVIDQKWMDHIDDMDQMRQGISLASFAQKNPLIEYKFLSYDMFDELSNNIQNDTVKAMFNVRLQAPPEERKQVATPLMTNKDESTTKAPTVRKTAKIGRNDPCGCGSGKKFKQCCGREG